MTLKTFITSPAKDKFTQIFHLLCVQKWMLAVHGILKLELVAAPWLRLTHHQSILLCQVVCRVTWCQLTYSTLLSWRRHNTAFLSFFLFSVANPAPSQMEGVTVMWTTGVCKRAVVIECKKCNLHLIQVFIHSCCSNNMIAKPSRKLYLLFFV